MFFIWSQLLREKYRDYAFACRLFARSCSQSRSRLGFPCARRSKARRSAGYPKQAGVVIASLLASLYQSAKINTLAMISAFFSSHTQPRFSPMPFAVKFSTIKQMATCGFFFDLQHLVRGRVGDGIERSILIKRVYQPRRGYGGSFFVGKQREVERNSLARPSCRTSPPDCAWLHHSYSS